MNIENVVEHAAVAEAPPKICQKLFPGLAGCTYLDTGSAGVSPLGQGPHVAAFYQSEDPARIGSRLTAHWEERTTALRQTLAETLGVAATEIAFFSGTTEGLNTVCRSLEWHACDEILYAEDDFPSITQAWHSASDAGAFLRPITIASEAERTEALIAALTPRTRVLTAAHVHSVRGTRIDLARIGRACRANGTLFVVDGIHAFGATPVELDHVDVYLSGTFKWLLSGFGTGIAVLRPTARAQMRPPVRGYRNRLPEDSYEYAHLNYSGLYALEFALDVLGHQIGWGFVHARTEYLVQCLADDLALLGLSLAAPPGARAGVASLHLDDAEHYRAALAKRGIHVAAKGDYLRVSPFVYNARADITHFSQALKELV